MRSNTKIIKVILTIVLPLCDSANQVERCTAVVRLRAASHCPPPPSLLRVLTLVRGGCAVRRQQRQQQRLHGAPLSSRQDEKPQGGTLRRAAVGGKGGGNTFFFFCHIKVEQTKGPWLILFGFFLFSIVNVTFIYDL